MILAISYIQLVFIYRVTFHILRLVAGNSVLQEVRAVCGRLLCPNSPPAKLWTASPVSFRLTAIEDHLDCLAYNVARKCPLNKIQKKSLLCRENGRFRIPGLISLTTVSCFTAYRYLKPLLAKFNTFLYKRSGNLAYYVHAFWSYRTDRQMTK